ncbi:hypothetical protein CEXT_437081 [Caerostris extrusa]|uniref:Uncharacterized protein n=1 Tax=Caerostris extrusa TaxID=172846 RepID=A0AAV4SA33_CAEEX|nr:hypothetical protein CEXT_437081 [Caerostris extrusa]
MNDILVFFEGNIEKHAALLSYVSGIAEGDLKCESTLSENKWPLLKSSLKREIHLISLVASEVKHEYWRGIDESLELAAGIIASLCHFIAESAWKLQKGASTALNKCALLK